jgi:hypothetical protein
VGSFESQVVVSFESQVVGSFESQVVVSFESQVVVSFESQVVVSFESQVVVSLESQVAKISPYYLAENFQEEQKVTFQEGYLSLLDVICSVHLTVLQILIRMNHIV